MPLPHEVAASLNLAKSLRQSWEPRFQRLVELAMPYTTHFFGNDDGSNGQARQVLYDETGMVAVEEFANRLQNGIVPNGLEWARFETSDRMSDEDKAGLQRVQREMFRQLSNTNFEPETQSSMRDLAGFGNLCLALDHGDWMAPIRFQSINFANAFITPGMGAAFGDIHVRRRVPGYVIKAMYPDATMPEAVERNLSHMFWLWDSWIRDLGAAVETWRQVCHVEERDVLHMRDHEGQGSCRYVFARWTRGSGELYGTGQGMKALPAMEVVNQSIGDLMAHAALALAGMWQAEDDGVLNPYSVQLVPGAIIPIAPGSGGLKPLVQPGTRLEIGDLVIEQQRMQIRKVLYNETLTSRTADTPLSAMEISERMRELARQIGPAYGWVWQEFVVPLLARVRKILVERGVIRMPIIDGRRIKVASASSMVRAAAQGEVQMVDRWIAGMLQVYGPQAVAARLPIDKYIAYSVERLGIPADLPYDEAQARAKMVETGQMLGQAAASVQQAGIDPQSVLGPAMKMMGAG